MTQASCRLIRIAVLGLALLGASCGGTGGNTSPGSKGPPSGAEAPEGLTQLPGASATTFALRVFPKAGASSQWCVFRGWPDERLHVFADCGSAAPREMPFTRSTQTGMLVFAVAESGSGLWLLIYDAERNIPSGRIPGTVSDGVDVYLFDTVGVAEPRLVAEHLPLGGFDNSVYATASGDTLTACAVSQCFSIPRDSPPTQWATAGLSSYEFVEAAAGAQHVDALVRTLDDHVTGNADFAGFHYAWASLRPDGVTIERIAPDCVPYALVSGVAQASWKCATTRADLAELLAGEVARMPADGMGDFGASNLEGRVAWSQAYYLNGLMQLGGGRLPELSKARDWTALRSRLRAEIRLLALRIASGSDGLASKRYSLHRTQLLFALHLGRVARLLRTAADTDHDSQEARRARELLIAQLQSLQGTVEQSTLVSVEGLEFKTLGYTRGADFWADGSNVPYNYISGYVDGVLAAPSLPEDQVQTVVSLMQPLMRLEHVDSSTTWRYWWARGSAGWVAADDVSTNTPTFSGSSGTAHITYRSMDAAALLRLRARRSDAVSPDVVNNIRQLIAIGGLLPWVNEATGSSGPTVVLDPKVAYRYARSSAPWELQGQVWALEQLAEQASQ